MNKSEIKFFVDTVGDKEAVAALQRIEAAAQKAGLSVKKFLSSDSGRAALAREEISAMAKATEGAGNAADNAAGKTDRLSKAHGGLEKASRRSYFAQTALTTVLSAGINQAFLQMVDVMGQAIQRVDLISNFPKSMAALGLSAKDASESMTKLTGYIAQVGGNLQEATVTVTRFAEVTKNVKAATAEFVGVNNALIAGAAPLQVQKNAMEQLTQAYSRGKPQLIEWKSLMVAMPAQLNAVAQAMGFVNANSLGEALTNDKVSMQSFITELTTLATGTGPIAAQARAQMSGIEFSWNQLKQTLVSGMTAIIEAIGRENIVAFLRLLTQTVSVLAGWIKFLITLLFTLFNAISRVFGGPQLKLAVDPTAQTAANLGTAADNAGDLSDGLDDAGKSAKETAKQINKGLASFDKMNVLADKTSPDSGGGGGSGGKGGGGGGSPGGLSAADAGALNGIFDGISTAIPKITTAAKILAGILAGLAAIKFAQGLLDQFNGLIKTMDETAKNMDRLNKALRGNGEDKGFLNGPKQALKDFGAAVGAFAGSFVQLLFGSNVRNAIAKAARLAFLPIALAFGAIVSAIETMVLELAIALGVGVGVAGAILAAAVIAVVAAIVLVWLNWDKIWGFMKKTASDFWQWLQSKWDGAVNFFVGIWQAIGRGFRTAWQGIEKVAGEVWNAVVTVFVIGAAVLLTIFGPIIEGVINLFKGIVGAAIFVVTGIFDAFRAVAGWINDNVVTPVARFFSGLWDDIVSIFKAVGSWFGDRFQEAWDAIVNIWKAVPGWFTNVWNSIKDVFSVATGFFGGLFSAAWDAIKNVWSIVSGWFNTNVWQPIVTFFSPATSFFGTLFQNAWNAIVGIWSGVAGWFGGVWNGIVGVFNGVVGYFGSIFSGAWNTIVNIFAGAAGWFNANVIGPIGRAFNSIGDGIAGAFKGALNGVIGIVNGFLNSVNSNIDRINGALHTSVGHLPTIPRLAQGGVVRQSTLVNVGEAGAEAIVPLENNLEWLDKLAAKINTGNRSGQPIQLTVQIGEDKIVSKVIDLINEKTQMSGRNAILV